ncbi:MAG: hypothetical protein AAGI11_10400 [Pseudomonadota bacterium]
MFAVQSKRLSSWLLVLMLAFTPSSWAIVTIMDPAGDPVPNQSVSITLPGGEVKEGETDDDGILFWWIDGERKPVDDLPPGTVIDGGLSFTTVDESGMSTTAKVLIGVGIAGGLYLIVDDDDSSDRNNGGGSDPDEAPPGMDPDEPPGGDPDEPPGGDPDEPPGGDPDEPVTPGMGMLSVEPEERSITRTVGDDCPADVGSFTVSNTGTAELSYSVTPPSGNNANFSYNDGPRTVAANDSRRLNVDFECNPPEDVPGTVNQMLTIDAGTAGREMVNVSVTTEAADEEPGELTNEGESSFVKVHVIGGSPCPDPYGTIRISNTGGKPIRFDFSTLPFVVPDQSSGVLQPGQVITINVVFPCDGFQLGPNVGELRITSVDAEDGSTDTGSLSITFDLEVRN